jgi:hypothetical protein
MNKFTFCDENMLISYHIIYHTHRMLYKAKAKKNKTINTILC